AHHHHA
nr:Chain J, HIS TAG CLEAVED OFF [Homo sapiens]6MWZ_M Chain M, ALA-HIS-HIS-HIS-HIS-ALA [Pseudomonas aeruginosa UCBPP-PA14]